MIVNPPLWRCLRYIFLALKAGCFTTAFVLLLHSKEVYEKAHDQPPSGETALDKNPFLYTLR